MRTIIYISIIIYTLISVSCRQDERNETYELLSTGKYLQYKIADDIKIPQFGIFIFEDKNKKKRLTFQNERNEIVLYDILSGDFLKRVVFKLEGSNAIPGGFAGYHIHDFNHIFISSLYAPFIFHSDTTATIKKKIHFQETDDGRSLIPFALLPGRPITVMNNKFYIPQGINPLLGEKMMEDSRIGAVIDTTTNTIEMLPMNFPPLITYKDIGTSAGFGADYSYCYDGTSFIYSFFHSEIIYRTSPSFDKIEEIKVKSRYLDNVDVLRINSFDHQVVLKATLESPSYGNLIYDRYRDVYYRFAYLKTELSPKDDPFVIISSGKKKFSILILDKDLNILGETLFPENTYNSKLYFVLEDGLYLSTNHVKSPQYSDDILTFERIDLVEL